MTGLRFIFACLASVSVVVTAAISAEPVADPAVGQQDMSQVQAGGQVQSQKQAQQQVRSGNAPDDSGSAIKGNQGRSASPCVGSEVRQGPYGDRQKAKKSGSGGNR